MTRLAQWRRAAATMAGRLFHAIGRCRRGSAALEFALVATPLMTLMFGFIATSGVFYTWSAMQGNAQYAALLVSTGQVKSWTTGAVTCSGSLSNTKAEYYACTGLPSWATFTVTTTENCAAPNVTVSISANAERAAITDVYEIFTGKTLLASSVVIKQGQCP